MSLDCTLFLKLCLVLSRTIIFIKIEINIYLGKFLREMKLKTILLTTMLGLGISVLSVDAEKFRKGDEMPILDGRSKQVSFSNIKINCVNFGKENLFMDRYVDKKLGQVYAFRQINSDSDSGKYGFIYLTNRKNILVIADRNLDGKIDSIVYTHDIKMCEYSENIKMVKNK